jgi:hypothetical protein
MKRTFTIALFGLSAVALFGCPVFSGSGGGPSNQCSNGYCPNPCNSSGDCPSDQVCEFNYCTTPLSEASTDDGGDCLVNGCPGDDQECAVVDGGVSCVTLVDGGLPEGAMPPATDGGLDGTAEGASDATPDAPVFTGCTSNADCGDGGSGVLCLDGQCVTPANQCTDTTQCPDSEECVQGGCVPTCSSTMPCPTGYSCTTNGVCTGNPSPCGTADGGAKCTNDTTCVDQRCVTRCGTGDVACADGLVCVDNGCIPDQKPVFVCNTDGVQGKCDTGSICLHHSCYIACDPEASTSCAKADTFNICKPVTTSSGTHYVCASSSNLGSQCDPTRDVSCPTTTDVCIDGYCR